MLASFAATAQMNRVSIGLNTFTAYSQIGEYPDGMPMTTSTNENKRMLLLPTLGYYRMLDKTVGIGLEFGYGKENFSSENVQTTSAYRYVNQSTTRFSSYHLCPSVFEMFSSANGKYRYITSVSVPVSITPEQTATGKTYRTDAGTGLTTVITDATNAPTTKLGLGLFLSGSIQRRLVGNLFLGAQLGIGANYNITNVDGDGLVISMPGTPDERRSETYNKNVSKQTNFAVEPAVSLNYFF